MLSKTEPLVPDIPLSNDDAKLLGEVLASDLVINALLESLDQQSQGQRIVREDAPIWIQKQIDTPIPAIEFALGIRFRLGRAEYAIRNNVASDSNLQSSFVQYLQGVQGWIERSLPDSDMES